MTGISDKRLPLWILACHVVETLHSYKYWSPARPSPTVGKCDNAVTNVVRRQLFVSLTTGYVAWFFRSVRCIVEKRPSMLNVCVKNLSCEQYDNYSLGVSYCEQLPAHLSNTQHAN